MKKKLFALVVFVVALASFNSPWNSAEAAPGGTLPPWPVIYSGDVTLGGQAAPDGLWVVGRMEGYTSVPLQVKSGRIAGLAVGGPDTSFFNKTITFELRADPNEAEGAVVAEQTDVFMRYLTPTLKANFDLTFPDFPTPTPLPTATATATPVPTATPLATATPIVVGTVVYNGMVVASGGAVPGGASLTARVGNYESNPVPVNNGQFISLIVDLNDPALTGAEVSFYLDGIMARTTAVYDVGSTIRNIDLIFMDLPAAPTSTSVPVPTTPPAPTQPVTVAETVVETPTVAPAPTVVPVLETPTPIVLVVTVIPDAGKVEEVEKPVDAATEEGGGCGSVQDIDPLTGAGNVLAMLGPVLLLVAFRGYRRIF